MVRWHHERQLIAQDLRGLQLRLTGHEGNRAQVETVIEHFVRNVPRVDAVHADLHAGMLLVEARQRRNQRMDGAFVDPQGELAAPQAIQISQPLLYFVAQVEEPLGVLLEELAGVGEADGARAAHKQRLAQGVLELADGQADGRLGAIKLFGGPGKAALAGHRQKHLQFAEIHGVSLRKGLRTV